VFHLWGGLQPTPPWPRRAGCRPQALPPCGLWWPAPGLL